MTVGEAALPATRVLDCTDLQRLLAALRDHGYEVVAPTVLDGAIGLAAIEGIDDLPHEWRDRQEAGWYRLEASAGAGPFSHATSVQSWKRYLYPPVERLLCVHPSKGTVVFDPIEPVAKRLAFFGVRACDLWALRRLDGVLGGEHPADVGYAVRREGVFLVAVNCTDPAATCFCASMGTGPAVASGYDLKLTPLPGEPAPSFLLDAGTAAGKQVVDELAARPASEAEAARGEAAIAAAAASLSRRMVPEVACLLRGNLDHPIWTRIGERCLACGNCTLVCPTCFCVTLEDTTDFSGTCAERWRRSDSCFSTDFSYIHGGSLRRSRASRYRQWMTHKLLNWWEQFGASGCVGCGRCITWCPVGIDITAEADALAESSKGMPS